MQESHFPALKVKQVRDKAGRMGLSGAGSQHKKRKHEIIDLADDEKEEDSETETKDWREQKREEEEDLCSSLLGKGPAPHMLSTKKGVWFLFNQLHNGEVQVKLLKKHGMLLVWSHMSSWHGIALIFFSFFFCRQRTNMRPPVTRWNRWSISIIGRLVRTR